LAVAASDLHQVGIAREPVDGGVAWEYRSVACAIAPHVLQMPRPHITWRGYAILPGVTIRS
jgi:hypothetical protein